MQQIIYDVCVVGSGPGGGISSYVLASEGLKVALVESGKWLRPGVDYGGHTPLSIKSWTSGWRQSEALC